MLLRGLETYGVLEGAGAVNNPTIMAWAKEVGLQKVYSNDTIPWCGLWMAVVAKRAGKPVVKDPLWAKNWDKFGVQVKDRRPMLGDVVVFNRPGGGGHVGLYVGEDDKYCHLLGGNTSDSVKIARIAISRWYGMRRPAYKNQPPNVRRIRLDATGEISTNEA